MKIREQHIYKLTEKYPVRFKSHQMFEDIGIGFVMLYLEHNGDHEMLRNFLEDVHNNFSLKDSVILTRQTTFFLLKYAF